MATRIMASVFVMLALVYIWWPVNVDTANADTDRKPATLPVLTIELLKKFATVEIRDSKEWRARYGHLVAVSCSIGDISEANGKYWVEGYGRSDVSLEDAAEQCLQNFTIELLKQPQRAREIEEREKEAK